MRSVVSRKRQAAVSAIGAAAFAALTGSSARAINGAPVTFTISVFNMGIQTVGNNQWQDWVIAATRTDHEGTGLDAIDVTIDTGGTANLGIDVEAVSGTGVNTKYDANIDGGTFDNTGVNTVINGDRAAPLFGDAVGGTFIGIGTSELIGNGAVPGFTTDITNNPFVTQAGATGINSTGMGVIVSGKGLVFVNGNVGTSNIDPYGPVGGLFLPAHGGRTLSPQFTNSGSVNAGSTGNALINGAVTKLEVIVTEGDPGQVASVASGPIPFANVVVPPNTVFTVSGTLAPDSSVGGPSVDFRIVVPTQQFPHFFQYGASLIGPLDSSGAVTMVGSNGHYIPQTVTLSGNAQYEGNLAIAGFQPANDQVILGLRVSGTVSIGSLISDLNNLVQNRNPGAIVEAPTGQTGAYLTSLGENIEVIFPPSSNPPSTLAYFSYDMNQQDPPPGGFAAAITQITVLPEPAAFSLLVLGGAILIGRRRRANKSLDGRSPPTGKQASMQTSPDCEPEKPPANVRRYRLLAMSV